MLGLISRRLLRRPVAVFTLFAAVSVAGLFAAWNIPLELTPSIDFPKLYVSVMWPGVSPKIMEANVTSLIEGELTSIDGIHKIESNSYQNFCGIILQLEKDAKVDFVRFLINEKLSFIRDKLPKGAYPPQVLKYVPDEFKEKKLISYHVTGPYSDAFLRNTALKKIVPALTAISGVAGANTHGGRDRNILISLDWDKMEKLGLDRNDVIVALNNANLLKNCGSAVFNGARSLVSVKEELKSVYDMGEIPLACRNGIVIRLKDAATISDSLSKSYSFKRINLKSTILIELEKEKNANTIKTADRIYRAVEDLKGKLPPGMELIKEDDASVMIRDNIKKFLFRSLFSFFIILLVLILFLRHLSSALIVQFSIVMSVLFSLLAMFVFGINLNILTFAGLALGFGIFVDNSIVVLENIYRYRQEGVKNRTACRKAPGEIALPVVASTLTTIAVLAPFVYMMEELKIYYLPFAVTVTLALLASLVTAFFFIPSAEFQLSRRARRDREKKKTPSRLSRRVDDVYGKVLHKALKRPVFTLCVAVWFFGLPLWKLPASLKVDKDESPATALLKESYNHVFRSIPFQVARPYLEYAFGGSSYLFNRFVRKREFWNYGNETYLQVIVGFPQGTDIMETDKVVRIFEKTAAAEKGVSSIHATIYSRYATVRIKFTPEAENSITPYVLEAKMTMASIRTGNCDVSVSGYGPGFSKSGYGKSSTSRLGLELTGYNYYDLNRLAERIGKKLKGFARVRNVRTNKVKGYYDKEDNFEQSIRLDRKALSFRGISADRVLFFLTPYINESAYNQKIRVSFDNAPYSVKSDNYDSFQFFELDRLKINDGWGRFSRLDRLSRLETRLVEPMVKRVDQRYHKRITFEYLAPHAFQEKFVKDFLKTLDVPPGYHVESEGQLWFFGSREEKEKDIAKTLLIALALMYIVLAGLYESFLYPLLIFMIIPLSLIGVFLIYYITGVNFNQSAYIGVIFLFGIVVNNAIVLLDHINLLKRKKKHTSLRNLLVQAGKDRARPVLMTMITTVAGLSPMVIFESGNTKDIWYTLSLSTIGGLVSSTILGLIVLPVLVFLLEKMKHYRKSILSPMGAAPVAEGGGKEEKKKAKP